MSNAIRRIRESIKNLGVFFTMRLVILTIFRLILLPRWYLFRVRNLRCLRETVDSSYYQETVDDSSISVKEQLIRGVIASSSGKSILECGIGQRPNVERIKLISVRDMSYIGCDFKFVCDHHQAVLKAAKLLNNKIMFVGNEEGTYSWSLFKLLQQGEAFDIVYLDGHHTFYVDYPAVILLHYLLRPGGYFMVDDVDWTINFLRRSMFDHFNTWTFYRNVYDFSEYNTFQQAMPHIRMIVEEFLIKRFCYGRIEQQCNADFWILTKPIFKKDT